MCATIKSMLWVETVSNKAKERYAELLDSGKPLVIRDEKTMSGRVHVGSLRGVAIHGLVDEWLRSLGIKTKFIFEINDFDPMDGLPVYLDKGVFESHMGKPLVSAPAPDGKTKNYAEYFGKEFIGVIKEIGYEPEFYRSSDYYRSGKYNKVIRLALDNAQKIREIYKRVSGAVKEDDWFPLSVVCEKCGKVGTTKASNWDGKKVSYQCGDFVEWAKGCGFVGSADPFDGRAKLPWKVEWAAKFTVFDVHIEGGGKDHSTRGGAREIADAISREVFRREPPINIPYEFIQAEGKKMSSSKGKGASSREVADLLPPKLLRTLLLQKEPQRVVEFIPDGDTIPVLFDNYDRFAKNYWAKATDDFARLFPFFHLPGERKELMTSKILPRFSNVAYLVQMPHLDLKTEIEKLESVTLSNHDISELSERAECAKRWLRDYAPEDYQFSIQNILPEAAKHFSDLQRSALSEVKKFIEGAEKVDGQTFHTTLHDIKTRLNISPKDFFSAIYLSILGKESGPKAGWFLSVLDREFLIKRLTDAAS